MNFCGAICEYNPFHNGHLKHLKFINDNITKDYSIIFMSGNFTQRGEAACMDKYTRAVHAIMGGADVVIEIPTVFAVANAEIFASGALKLFSSLKGKKNLCFGTEIENVKDLIRIAEILATETNEFKEKLKFYLSSGESFASSRLKAVADIYGKEIDTDVLIKPNNILAVEYIKAILKNNYEIDIKPILREGSSYSENQLNGGISSAKAIRMAIANGFQKKIKKEVPPFVYSSLPQKLYCADDYELFSLMRTEKSELRKISDCSEGLENRIKALLKDSSSFQELLNKLTTRRYTKSRLSRIILSSTLDISANLTEKCIKNKLYLKVLAINGNKPNILSDLSKVCDYPLITRKSDADKLSGIAEKCFEKDVFANDFYGLISGIKTNEYDMKIVKFK